MAFVSSMVGQAFLLSSVPSICNQSSTTALAKKRQTGMSVLLTRRGTSCIFSLSRKGKDRCAPLSRQLSPALELPLARGRSDTANLFAGAAGGVRFRAPPQATAAVHLHAL